MGGWGGGGGCVQATHSFAAARRDETGDGARQTIYG